MPKEKTSNPSKTKSKPRKKSVRGAPRKHPSSNKMEEEKVVTDQTTPDPDNEPKEPMDLTDLSQLLMLDSIASEAEKPKIRLLSLHGEVNEDNTAELVYSLVMLHKLGEYKEYSDPEDPESEILTKFDPLELMISTYGGSAPEMFAIYDTMRMVRKDCEVSTIGIGKVMSAGVLLLASGTKGKRKVMKNCRIMMHSVIGASHGSLHSLENEMDEIRYLQDQHITCLVQETDMTRRYLKKLMDRKVNVYLTAEEAVELGIADEII
jgi:ATP-dependent Clp protease, protease subunit